MSEALAAIGEQLHALPVAVGDEERVGRIRRLEELKAMIAAVQIAETTAFVVSQRAAQTAAGEPAERVGRGIAAQVALARRISPHRAQREVGWAMVLTIELPRTYAALRRGETSEWRAQLVARETIWLSRKARAVVDAELGPRLESLGDRAVETEAKKIAYQLDPAGFTDRARHAETERRVWLRPAPDTMCRLTALLPVAQGVAAYAALGRHADTTISDGDGRGRGQVMADTLVERVTGQASAEAVPVEIELLLTDKTLLAVGDEPAVIPGYGPVPAPLARDLAQQAGAPRWLRRLYRHPRTGELAALETRRREFTENQRRFLRLRDQGTCRTPWCDAPIRHHDHVLAVEHGGPTSVANAQGLCQACNHAKQAPGWTTQHRRDHIVIVTPTRHTYRHRPPDPPGTDRGLRSFGRHAVFPAATRRAS